MHVSKDDSYAENNIVLSFIYQIPDVNSERMFWMVTNGRYWIVCKHALNNSYDIVLTSGTTTSMVNIVAKGIAQSSFP